MTSHPPPTHSRKFQSVSFARKMASADAMAALRAQLDALQAENAALRAEAAELHGFEWFARFVEWFLGRMVIVSALVGGFSGFLSLGLHVKAIVVAVAIAAYFRRGHVEMLALKLLAIGFLVGHLFGIQFFYLLAVSLGKQVTVSPPPTTSGCNELKVLQCAKVLNDCVPQDQIF